MCSHSKKKQSIETNTEIIQMIQLDKNSKEAIINIFKNSEDDICIINKFRISERNSYYKNSQIKILNLK